MQYEELIRTVREKQAFSLVKAFATSSTPPCQPQRVIYTMMDTRKMLGVSRHHVGKRKLKKNKEREKTRGGQMERSLIHKE